MLAAGMICFNVASGLITRPLFKEFFLMYTHSFLVTSVRGIDLPPQMAANAGLSVFGAKMPTLFFMAKAFFLPVADIAALPLVRFSALIFLRAAFVIVVFFVVVVGAAVLVVVVISIEERM